jgi:hypothetical protein
LPPPDRSWSWSRRKSLVNKRNCTVWWMGSSSGLPTEEFCNPEYRCRGMVHACACCE